jgi:hypothetical protein
MCLRLHGRLLVVQLLEWERIRKVQGIADIVIGHVVNGVQLFRGAAESVGGDLCSFQSYICPHGKYDWGHGLAWLKVQLLPVLNVALNGIVPLNSYAGRPMA